MLRLAGERVRDVVGRDLGLAQHVLRGRRRRVALARRVGDRGGVADRPDAGPAGHRAEAVGRDPAAVVERQPELGHDRMRLDAGGPRRVRVGTTRRSRARPTSGDALDHRARADLDPAPAQLGGRERGEVGRISAHHPVPRLDEDEAQAVQPRARVALDDVGGEVLQLGEALEPGVAGAHEHVREQRAAGRVVRSISACSSVCTSRLRSAIASDSVLKPIACSASPGIGSVRDVEPSATISWS